MFVAPPDYQQGQTAKIMYVHVPSAWLAMFGYVLVAASSFGLLVFRHPLADVSAKAAAPIGAVFTALCLLTGMLWGKPMWGAFWVWDPRLTSVLILFLLYLGLIALRSSIEDESLAGKLTAVLALVGIVIIPVIKFSVDWNSLHQPASITRLGAPAIHTSLLWPLLVMASGMALLFAGPASQGDAQRDPAAARQGAAHRQGRRRRRVWRSKRLGSDAWISDRTLVSSGRRTLIVAVVLSLLVAWLVLDGRRLQRLLDELEAHGVRRRSGLAAQGAVEARMAEQHTNASTAARFADRPARLAAGDLLRARRHLRLRAAHRRPVSVCRRR